MSGYPSTSSRKNNPNFDSAPTPILQRSKLGSRSINNLDSAYQSESSGSGKLRPNLLYSNQASEPFDGLAGQTLAMNGLKPAQDFNHINQQKRTQLASFQDQDEAMLDSTIPPTTAVKTHASILTPHFYASPYSAYPTTQGDYPRFLSMLSPLLSSLTTEELRVLCLEIFPQAKPSSESQALTESPSKRNSLIANLGSQNPELSKEIAWGSRNTLESLFSRKVFEGVIRNEKVIDISSHNEIWSKIFEFEEFEEIDCVSDKLNHFVYKNKKIAISRGFFMSKPIDKRGTRKQLVDLEKETCHCGEGVKENHLTLRCSVPTCKKKYHRGCVGWSGKYANFFECPRCVILSNDPIHRVQKILIEPCLLARQVDYSFALASEDKKLIRENEEFGVEIRCIKMQFEHYFEQSWPDITRMTLNDRLVVEEKPTSDKKRRDRKPFLKKGLMDDELNVLNIQYSDHYDKKNKLSDFVITVVLVQKLKEKDICESIIATSRLDIEDCKKFIAAQTKQYGKDIQAQQYTCDLVCKLTLRPLRIPVRGVYCTHLQCFSLDNFVKIISKSDYRVWNCTICQKPAHRLVFDLVCSNVIFKAMEQKQQTGVYPSKFTIDGQLNIRLLTDEEQSPSAPKEAASISADTQNLSTEPIMHSPTAKSSAPSPQIQSISPTHPFPNFAQHNSYQNVSRSSRPSKPSHPPSHTNKSAHKMPLLRRTKLGQNIPVMPCQTINHQAVEKEVRERRKDRVLFVSQREEGISGCADQDQDDLGCFDMLTKRTTYESAATGQQVQPWKGNESSIGWDGGDCNDSEQPGILETSGLDSISISDKTPLAQNKPVIPPAELLKPSITPSKSSANSTATAEPSTNNTPSPSQQYPDEDLISFDF